MEPADFLVWSIFALLFSKFQDKNGRKHWTIIFKIFLIRQYQKFIIEKVKKY